MCWDQHLTSTIQFLCISSTPETSLHVTLKRRAEISADIFARLLRYFPLVLQEFDESCLDRTLQNLLQVGYNI